jgi:hypothetical protein
MSEETAAALARTGEILLQSLAAFCLSKPDCKYLWKDEILQRIEFRCQQIADVNDITEVDLCSGPEHRLGPLGHREKHTALDQGHEWQTLEWTQQNAKRNTPVIRKEIKDYYASQFHAPISRGWVNSFILRHPEDIIQIKRSPQEKQCLQVPRVFRERPAHNLKAYVQGYTSELIFNLEKVGISDWEGRRVRKVVIMAFIRRQTIHHGISRNMKHISLITCVSATGESYTLYRITSQMSAPIREQLKKDDVHFGTDLILKSNLKPSINVEIRLDSMRTVFLPNLTEVGTLDESYCLCHFYFRSWANLSRCQIFQAGSRLRKWPLFQALLYPRTSAFNRPAHKPSSSPATGRDNPSRWCPSNQCDGEHGLLIVSSQ